MANKILFEAVPLRLKWSGDKASYLMTMIQGSGNVKELVNGNWQVPRQHHIHDMNFFPGEQTRLIATGSENFTTVFKREMDKYAQRKGITDLEENFGYYFAIDVGEGRDDNTTMDEYLSLFGPEKFDNAKYLDSFLEETNSVLEVMLYSRSNGESLLPMRVKSENDLLRVLLNPDVYLTFNIAGYFTLNVSYDSIFNTHRERNAT